MKVFISHSSDDKLFVRTLKRDLKENGIHTWLDEDELELGDSLLERLEQSIDDTSHFMIILSESSVNSVWVKTELEHVLKGIKKRIIPIIYKTCQVPLPLQGLIMGDVSSYVRTVQGDFLNFHGDQYDRFMAKLVRSLRATSTVISTGQKRILSTPQPVLTPPGKQNLYLRLKILGYDNTVSREGYVNKIKNNLNPSAVAALKETLSRPIVLPLALKTFYPDIKLGTIITMRNNANEQRKGVFAGFRSKNDDTIILPISVRNYLNLSSERETYDFVVSPESYDMVIL